MKPGWTYKKLPEISENLDSIRKPVTKKNRTAGIYPYYGASGIVDYVDDYLFDEDLLCISEDGANLLMRTYPIAFPISGKVWVNNHAHVLRFESLTTQRYVEYFFTGLKLDDYITGAAQPKLTQKALNSIVIKIPTTISEQHRIVERLDASFAQIDELKANAEKQVNEARALFQRALTEAMEPKEGWGEFMFSDVIKLQSGDYLSSKEYVRGEFPVYGGNGIAGYHNKYNKDGEIIVVGRVGALCGNVHYIKNPIWLTDNGFEVIVQNNFDFDKKFLSRYLKYMDLGKYARQAAQPVISNSSLKDIPMFIPPLSEQHRIVARLDVLSARVRELEEIQKNVITECDNMKQAILRQVFE